MMRDAWYVVRGPWWVGGMVLVLLTAGPPDRLTAQTKLADNSFLVEEAYNQETRVVQHISTAELHRGSTEYTFTQEWPLGGPRYQLSYTLVADQESGFEMGDALVNFRWGLRQVEGAKVWIAPRLSAVVPVGIASRLGGNGGWGAEVELPVSLEVSKYLSLHGNLGTGWRPDAEGADGTRATTVEPWVAGSAVFFLTPMVNLMAESVWRREQAVVNGSVESANTHALLLGGRVGINVSPSLQIVPGAAWMPAVDATPTRAFLYLSFEHGF